MGTECDRHLINAWSFSNPESVLTVAADFFFLCFWQDMIWSSVGVAHPPHGCAFRDFLLLTVGV